MTVKFYQCGSLPANEETGLTQMCEICFNKIRYDGVHIIDFHGPGEPESMCDSCDFETIYAEALEPSTIGATNKEGDITLYDWMKGSGGCAGMTAQEIADEWDALNEWDLVIDDTEDREYD